MKLPVIFVGHGSPMNGIANNSFTKGWEELASLFPKPTAILAISAHWYTRGIRVNNEWHPRQIFDMSGFPKELYQVEYRPPGLPWLAKSVAELLSEPVIIDNCWGIDHGIWSVLTHMYPEADIPVSQLSIPSGLSGEAYFKLGEELSPLRDEKVLILCSGNVVHNLRMLDWSMELGGYTWANEFDEYIKTHILNHNNEKIWSVGKNPAVPTREHFIPLLYALGASNPQDQIRVFNDERAYGSISMTSYLFGGKV